MLRTHEQRSPTARRILGEAGALLLVALLLAGISWGTRRPLLPLWADTSAYEFELPFPLMNGADALAAYEAGSHLFVDVRPVDPGLSEHVPGAFSIRLESFSEDLGAVLDFIYPQDPLILYGEGDLQRLAAVAERFRERGYENIQLLRGGLPAWREAGGEITGGEDD